GSALNRNPFPIIVPCHRVVRSDRSVGQYAFGRSLKKRLLEIEGAC
ncbi:MAG: MGMT family protein, partial [Candidatus Omnitrophota bacterium]